MIAATRRRPPRLTVVGRLTALYGTFFAITATAVAVASYALLQQSFRRIPSPPQFFADAGLPPPDRSVPPGPEQAAQLDQVVTAARRQLESNVLDSMVHRTAVLVVVAVPLVTLAAWLLARRSVRPVRRVTTLAREISDTNLHRRIGLAGPRDELTELADTFDDMLARLEQAFTAQRAFAAHASHELRTPLTVMIAEAELALADPRRGRPDRGLAVAVLEGGRRCEALLSGLLAISRADSGTAGRETVDLGELCGEVVSDLAATAGAAGVHVELHLDQDTPVRGDPSLLRALAGNLVLNAIQYNDARGTLVVVVGAGPDGARLQVTNTGPELTETDVGALMRPFHRLQPHMPGSGIGTAVINAVTAAHGGRVQADARVGGGLTVTIHLPRLGSLADAFHAVPQVENSTGHMAPG